MSTVIQTAIYIINAPVLTGYGVYNYGKISITTVKKLLRHKFVSAIGHQSTADFLTAILGIKIPMNRIEMAMNSCDTVIVFRLLKRPPEGKILTIDELKDIPYEFGMLTKL